MENELTAATPISLAGKEVKTGVNISRPVGTSFCLIFSDLLAILFSLVVSFIIRDVAFNRPAVDVLGVIVPAVLLVLSSMVAAGLYPAVCENPVEELRRSFYAITLAFTSLGVSTFFLRDMSQSRMVLLFSWILSVVLVPSCRSAARTLFVTRSWWGSPVAILGSGQTGKLLLETLTRNPRIGLRPVAVLDDNPQQYTGLDDSLTTGPLSRCLELARDHRISYAIVCMPSLSRKELLRLLDQYGHCFRHIMVIPDLIGMASLGLSVREVSGVIGLEVTQKLLQPSARFAKRVLDLTLTLAISPVVMLTVAIAAILVRLESRGPILLANERVGMGGRKFKAWKLRSMVVNGDEVLKKHFERHPEALVEWQATQKLKNDPRVTRVGKIIRKASIDELPQLWNVLIGEMSLVGPRPMLEKQVALYGSGFESYRRVRPGITGLWQISGRNHLTFSERASLDSYTIRNWSVWMDIYILARTISVVLTANGAY
jgi:Undecaprenyl-phosphate galactose phosphotransferase WbaP